MASDCSWDYDCPQYFDFEAPQLVENIDRWFDLDHENEGAFTNDDSENIEPKENIPVANHTRSRTKSNATPVKTSKIPRSRSHTPRVASDSLKEGCDGLEQSKGPTRNKDPVSSPAEPMTDSKRINGLENMKGQQPGSNICQSIEAWKKKKGGSQQEKTSQENDGTRKTRSLTRSQSVRQPGDGSSVKNGKLYGMGKPISRSFTNKSLDRNQNIRNGRAVNRSSSKSPRSLKRSLSKEPQIRKDENSKLVNKSADSGPLCKVPKICRSTTPTCLKRMPGKSNNDGAKTTEQLELERIAYLKKELAKKREMSQKSYQKAMVSKGYMPIFSSKEPTAAEEFHFKTDSRIKSHDMETRSDATQVNKDFISGLRSQDKSSEATLGPKRPTIPQPFHLTESNKSKPKAMDGYKSVAEQVIAFHKQTPDRFRQKTRSQSLDRKRGRTASPKRVTIPETPNLETKQRSRPVMAPSQQDMEDKELEEMKMHQFKANPVNEKIFQHAHGIKKVRSKSVTKPMEFNLQGNKFIKANKSQEEEKKYEFKAQPVPKKILEGQVGVKPLKVMPVTIAESPAFALKHRARIPVEVPDEDTQHLGPTARPVPHMGIPFQPTLTHKTTVPEPFNFEARNKMKRVQKDMKIQEYLEEEKKEEHARKPRTHPVLHVGIPYQPTLSHKCTVPEPFSFEERDKQVSARKEEKIQDLLQKEAKAREFHANPLPSGSSNLPSKPVKPVTIPEPFNLEADHRGQRRAEEWRHKLEEELKQQREASKFKAKPTTVLLQDPFLPQKSCKPPTAAQPFMLNTEERAEQRDELDIIRKHKQAELESIKRQQEKEEEEKEKQAVAKLRQDMVHKSNPVRKYKKVEPQAREKILTLPESPVFATNARLRSHVRG